MTLTGHRKNPRHGIQFKVVYDDGDSFNAAFVDNASLSGLRLEVATPMQRGRHVTIEPVEGQEDALFSVRARVVYCEPAAEDGREFYHAGLELLDLGEKDRVAVGAMIDALEGDEEEARQSHWDPFLGTTVDDSSRDRS